MAYVDNGAKNIKVSASTVREAVKSAFGMESYTALVNGRTATPDTSVGEFDVITVAQAVKGGK